MVKAMMLFFWCQANATDWLIAPADTIIIDGEIIYIERKERVVDVDSMNEEGAQDVREPRPFKGGAALWMGAVFSTVNQAFEFSDYAPVDVFLGKERRYSVAPSAGAQVWVDLGDHWSLAAGLGLERITCSWSVFDTSLLAPLGDLLKLENRDGELWQYYTYPVGPGVETDTTQVPLTDQTVQLRHVHIPVSARYRFKSNADSPWSFFAEAGAMLTLRKASLDEAYQTMAINASGDIIFYPLPPVIRRSIRPWIAAGISRQLTSNWSAGIRVSSPLLASSYLSMDDEPEWQFSGREVSLQLGIIYTLGQRYP